VRSWRASLVAIALALLGPRSAPADDRPKQNPTPTPPVFAARSDVVNLTVTVLDKEGNLVLDLEAQDFQVYEDGRPQRVEIFGRAQDGGHPFDPRTNEALVLDLGLLMDTSESMLKELKLSQQSAIRFLEAVPRARDLVTVFFDSDIQVSRYDGEQQQGLIDRIQALKGGGWTALYDAIAVYLSRAEDSGGGRRVLVLFTDGEDSRSVTTLGEVLKMVRSSPVTVYAIAFSQGLTQSRRLPAKAFLQGLAGMTGGEVFSPTSFRDLPAIYDKILQQLSAQYVIGYVSDNPKQDGKLRHLKVEVSERELSVRHREGYVATEDKADRSR
jgi:Ca-activated chloride channel family protein